MANLPFLSNYFFTACHNYLSSDSFIHLLINLFINLFNFFNIKKPDASEISKKLNFNAKMEDDEFSEDLHSPMPIHFPEKIHMKNNTVDEVKYIMPPLDLTKTKKGGNNAKNNSANIKSNNTISTPLKTEEVLLIRKKNFEIVEWQQTIKLVGLSQEEIERFFNNKMISKLIDSLENLVKIIAERNEKIKILTKENLNLSSQLSTLKTEQLNLTKNFILLKDKYKDIENKINNTDDRSLKSDTSMMVSLFRMSFFLLLLIL